MGAQPEQIQYQFVDDIPELASARQAERQFGQALLDSRKAEYAANQETDGLPPEIDALSTARAVLESQDQVEAAEKRKGLTLDCQRLVAEWYRKKKPEYFPPVRHIFDEDKQEFFSHGLSIRQMTENALTPIVDDQEEEARRLNEKVEDATPQFVRSMGATALGIRTISECTDSAISAYQQDAHSGTKHRGYRGYVPEIEKVMIRDIRLDAESLDRFEEQIGMPGLFVTHEIIQMALERRGLTAKGFDKTQLHGAQILVEDDLLEFAELLDTVAGEQWCVNVFMGEEVPQGYVKDYASFRKEALQRQAGLKDIADSVANFTLTLAADPTLSSQEAPAMVEEFVKLQLLELAKEDFDVAEQMFDTATAHGLREVAYLEASGQYQRAFERLSEVQAVAPGGGFCGAGSCGIVAVNELSGDAGKARELGLGKGLLYDTVRSCPGCKAKKVFYDAKANKACLGCNTKQINGKTSKASTQKQFSLAV